jgi:hypothetical protein
VSSEHRNEGGIPRARQGVFAPAGGVSKEESWPGANAEKADRLLVRSLKRRAGAQGLELRQSAYGYALIDSGRKPVKDRNDMSLAEIKVWLDRAPSP